MKNKTLAIDAAPSAIPPKPNIAATIAIIKKIIDQRNITYNLNGKRKLPALFLPEGYSLHPASLFKSLYQALPGLIQV
jgi:hypothetical protein